MARIAAVAAATSAKTTHACPRSLYDLDATMSMILPNCPKMACSDFTSSAVDAMVWEAGEAIGGERGRRGRGRRRRRRGKGSARVGRLGLIRGACPAPHRSGRRGEEARRRTIPLGLLVEVVDVDRRARWDVPHAVRMRFGVLWTRRVRAACVRARGRKTSLMADQHTVAASSGLRTFRPIASGVRDTMAALAFHAAVACVASLTGPRRRNAARSSSSAARVATTITTETDIATSQSQPPSGVEATSGGTTTADDDPRA